VGVDFVICGNNFPAFYDATDLSNMTYITINKQSLKKFYIKYYELKIHMYGLRRTITYEFIALTRSHMTCNSTRYALFCLADFLLVSADTSRRLLLFGYKVCYCLAARFVYLSA